MADDTETYSYIDKDKLAKSLIQLELLIKDIVSAFPKDEQGNPDYASHRIYHRDRMVEEENSKRSKEDIQKNVKTWAIIGVLTVLASSLAQAFLVPLLQAIKTVTSG